MTSPKEEFIELIKENSKNRGLDELSSKLMGVLYVEPGQVSLEELSKKSGYSLSAVSTAMKFLVRIGLVKSLKKPKSRKKYFYMEKDFMNHAIQHSTKEYERNIIPTLQKVPKIIENYKKEKSEKSKEELKILENYYKQVISFEKIMKNFLEMLEKAQKEGKE